MKTEHYLRLAGKVLIRGFEDTFLSGDLKRIIKADALGGLIVFRRNVDSCFQVAELLREACSLAPSDGLAVGVDQEGGRVVRIGEPLTILPPARTLGEMRDPALTENLGRLVGKELRAIGMTINFAPVLDVDTHPHSPVIGDRSFGTDPQSVVSHGLAFGRGLLSGGVLPCAKHFPGHGDAARDSHHSLPRVDHDKNRLSKIELAPFQAWCSAGLGPIMTAHIVFPALDPVEPATTSPRIIQGLLRGQMGFLGTVISDDLEMGAVDEVGGPKRVALQSIRAGVDALLVCRSFDLQEEIREAIAKEATGDAEFGNRLEAAAAQVERLALRSPKNVDQNFIGSPEHVRMKSELQHQLDRLTD